MSKHAQEIAAGQRFEFGKNWSRFLSTLNRDRIRAAEVSLLGMLRCTNLEAKSFLDIGCGSGLFSLAAKRLGARVHSFDYDPQSVACARQLKSRFFPQDGNWVVEEGSVLDLEYVQSLGRFDVVYAWGVLHHTGDMWKALDNAQFAVNDGGALFIAIYNDVGGTSRFWRKVKRLYCSGLPGRVFVVGVFLPYFAGRNLAKDLLRLRNPWRRYAEYKKNRGMSMLHDWNDWFGGYPYEVAKAEELLGFYRERGFFLQEMKTVRGIGNNQFVFKRAAREQRSRAVA